ncbi:MAG: UDP-3-O-(3-hydroxymyristoyl)glucosamine N-acyltransferase [Pseudomonadota bacterium]
MTMAGPPFSLGQLSELIQAELQGDPSYLISGLATLKSADATTLAFYHNQRYQSDLAGTGAGCVLLSAKHQDAFSGQRLIIDDPYLAYAKLTALFADKGVDKSVDKHADKNRPSSIHPSAVLAESVSLGEQVFIGPHTVIGNHVTIGDGVRIEANVCIGDHVDIGSATLIHANATFYSHVKVGEQCIFHSGSVIGADGFGFAPSDGAWQKIHQLGGVRIGKQVEIGANTTVDRGALDDTVIDNGVKIDNQVQIAHNVNIGDDTAIAAAVAIAGSTTIGKRCTIAGACGIVGHIHIVDDVHITAMSIVTKSIKRPGSYSSGVPMNTTQQWRKNAARFNQLDSLARQLQGIKKVIKKEIKNKVF